MTQMNNPQPYGVLTEPATLTIQRLLPGPIERVWAYLTESDLRKQWLASGEMEMRVGSSFELVWRNDELTEPAGRRPDKFGDEERMQSEITQLDPPNKLAFTWGSTGGVSIELEAKGEKVLLTIIHHRVTDRSMRVLVSSGWHTHLDVLAARLGNREPAPFWDSFNQNQQEYERRLPA